MQRDAHAMACTGNTMGPWLDREGTINILYVNTVSGVLHEPASLPEDGVSLAFLSTLKRAGTLATSVWRADDLETPGRRAWPSGFAALDAELPGGGWPAHAITEILMPLEGVIEWRLLAPLLAQVAAQDRDVLLVGPPQPPHPPGLNAWGLPVRRLVWLEARTANERVWCVEQLLKANTRGAVLAWLPQVRAAQMRRLQVLASGCEAPVLVCRPEAAACMASAAPLRLRARAAPGWAITVDILKRRGPPLTRSLELKAVPAGLDAVLPSRLVSSSPPLVRQDHVVVRTAPEHAWH
jgi:protein ImuA